MRGGTAQVPAAAVAAGVPARGVDEALTVTTPRGSPGVEVEAFTMVGLMRAEGVEVLAVRAAGVEVEV